MSGLWVTPTEFVELPAAAVENERLTQEIASRGRAWDSPGWFGLLPDPDPVLRSLPDGGVSVLEGLTADGHLISQIQQRKLLSLKREFRWEPGVLPGEKEPRPEAVRLRDNLAKDLERVDLYSLLSGILDAPLYGMAPVELSWAAPSKAADHLRLTDLQVKPARWFGFNERNEPRFISLNNPWEGEELPFGKFVFARHFPTYDNPYGLRLLSRCFWPVVFKKGGIRFWLNLAEKYGTPFLVGHYRPGASQKEQEEMLSRLVAMVRDAVAVVPTGSTVEILEAAGKTSSAEIHRDLAATMDAEISKVIVGQTLTTAMPQGGGGSYAASKTHENVLESFAEGDRTLSKTTLEEIAWVYGLVNAPGAAAPRLEWFEEEEPQAEFAERDEKLTRAGAKLTKVYFVRRYGFQEDEVEVVAAAPVPGVPAEEAPAAFAEGGAPGVDAVDNMDTVDRQVARLDAEAGPALGAMVVQIRALVDQAESLEALGESLAAAYPMLDGKGLADAMAEAMTAAALAGRYELVEGI